MAVYVDDMNLPADVPNGSKVVSSSWSHLMADTHEELMEAAAQLRLNPKWIQHPGTPKEHFDLTSGKRQQAIKREIAGPITWRQAGEMYAAKVQAQQEKENPAAVTTDPETFDYQAGCAFRDRDFDRARAILAQAMIEHPAERQLWADRLEAVNGQAAERSRPEPSPLPAPGVHRDGGTTTAGRFGLFDRAPEPAEPHYCPGCSTEKDGRVSGPKIEAQRDLCQGCGVLRTMGREVPREARAEAPAEPEAGQ